MLKHTKEVKGDLVNLAFTSICFYGVIPYFTLRACPSLKSRNSSVWKRVHSERLRYLRCLHHSHRSSSAGPSLLNQKLYDSVLV